TGALLHCETVMIQESLQYLRGADDPLRTVLIGGVLLVLSPLLIPVFTVTGYLLAVLRRTARGDEEPPIFDEWVDTTIDGAKAWLVLAVYVVLPAIVLAIAGILAAVSVFSVANMPAELSAVAGVVGFSLVASLLLVGTIAAIAGLYVTPAAIANYADTGQIRSGFAIGTLWPVLTSRTYLVGWLTAAVVVLGGSFVSGFVGSIPVAGVILAAFVSFYALVAAYYVIGCTWGDVRPMLVDREESVPAERPAI
ncbi:MAG: DUF4013 domain-containing protein, partial [Halobacteriota archaeon]